MKYIIVALLFVSNYGAAQSIEDMLADETPAVQKTAPMKTAQSSELVTAIQKMVAHKISEQTVVYRAIEASDWNQAVIQYPKVFESNSFLNSTNGTALFAFLQFQAGLKITALETLFKVTNPKEINAVLKKQLTDSILKDDPAWSMAKIKWSKNWNDVFDPSVAIWIDSSVMETKSIDELTSISKNLEMDSKEKSFVDWHLAIKYSLTDKSEKAAQLLSQIRKNPNSYINPDLVQITAARILFQNSYYDGAIKQYEKVSKQSNYWSQAQEEMGWSYVRKGQPQNAIAIGQSLVHLGMTKQVSSESFFMMSLAQLKICDYPAVIGTLSDYSKNFKEKNKSLKALVASSEDQNIQKFFKSTDKIKASSDLPSLVTVDRKLKMLIQKQNALQKESETADVLYAKSLALTGLQGHFESLKKSTLSRLHAAQSESVSRIKFLAANELENIKNNLDKLHIVEAEVISQVSIADQIATKAKDDGSVKKGITGSKSKDAVVFPVSGNEVWFDEVGSYKVSVKKACAAPAVQKEKTL
jgi:tetratricopeptide (TPR) repeat protein